MSCAENFDGGLPQIFLMEIWEPNELELTFNVTLSQGPPVFRFDGIHPDAEYELRLYAVNQKGRSEAVLLRTTPLKGVAMYTSKSNFEFFSPLFSVDSLSAFLISTPVTSTREHKKTSVKFEAPTGKFLTLKRFEIGFVTDRTIGPEWWAVRSFSIY